MIYSQILENQLCLLFGHVYRLKRVLKHIQLTPPIHDGHLKKKSKTQKMRKSQAGENYDHGIFAKDYPREIKSGPQGQGFHAEYLVTKYCDYHVQCPCSGSLCKCTAVQLATGRTIPNNTLKEATCKKNKVKNVQTKYFINMDFQSIWQR